MASTPWPSNEKTVFQAGFQGRINQTSPVTDDPTNPRVEDPVIVPPIYGVGLRVFPPCPPAPNCGLPI